MCGITGLFDTRAQRMPERARLHRMNESQHHRGPDEGDLHIEPGVGFGHRRLSVIDIATGQQPIFNDDKSVALVFNGEVYNYLELMDELRGHGYVFRTKSDSEAIVRAWEHWGEDCVHHLRGMFAFMIHDRRRDCLFMARDRLGVKPLHYALTEDGWLLFGSELKSLMAHGGLRRELDPRATEAYFALGYVPDPWTIYRHARKLAPGHRLLVRRGEPLGEPQRYWDVRFTGDARISEPDSAEELRRRLQESVKLRLKAEVPLGAFLSGGVDSSAVVATMAGLDSQPVNTCSIGFDDPRFNETEFAQLVADRYRTNHRVEVVNSDDFGLVDQLAHLYDEPFADSSAIPTYRVCELARRHVTVALSGDGGDEVFGGYRRYAVHMREERMRRALPAVVRRHVFGPLARYYPKADWAPRVFRAKTTFQAMARHSVDAYFNTMSLVREPLRQQLFSPALHAELQGWRGNEIFHAHAQRCDTDDGLALLEYLDMQTYLPGDINTKVDRASMAHSLEVREPLMDHPLVEWAATLPASLKLRGSEGKYLFKRAMEPQLPHDVLYRPKMGFAVPLAQWLRGPLRQATRTALLDGAIAQTGWFSPKVIARMLDQHERAVLDHSQPLWALLMFDAFLRNAGLAQPGAKAA
ncbi:MAG: asparagine synthetase B [Roseateles depolymerans]|uniref:asparagine synthase (glutamine-hydrolyzing) n=1 Tax=Roseateles depolymerans TaxID=76731 RepID=A0A2W5DIV0_9BURK|nr:MAG: asparagine synthetase B [Roseateles depolymerans]